jgi:hypothetical protein
MRDKPSPVDLDQLWKKLGVALDADEVIFNDKAPEAVIRKAITSLPKSRSGSLSETPRASQGSPSAR